MSNKRVDNTHGCGGISLENRRGPRNLHRLFAMLESAREDEHGDQSYQVTNIHDGVDGKPVKSEA